MAQKASKRHEELLGQLLDADILREDDEFVSLSPTFQQQRQQYREQMNNLSLSEVQEEFGFHLPRLTRQVEEIEQQLICDAMAVQEFLSDTDREEPVRIAFTLQRFDDPPRTSGAPDGFTPITGREIPAFLQHHPVSVLYFWREECEPCEILRAELEEVVVGDVLDDRAGLGAVYGPNSAEFIYEEYDVAVAPTILFCVADRIDSRYTSAKYKPVLQSEIEIIQESLPEK